MKTKSILIVSALSAFAAFQANASEDQNTLFQTRMWTDRNITNPALSVPESTINQSIERFWNLPERPLPETSSTVNSSQPACPPNTYNLYYRSHHQATTTAQVPPHRDHLAQQQSNNQRRGFLGINLFNIIPIVDIVYGKAESSSSDHVKAYK